MTVEREVHLTPRDTIAAAKGFFLSSDRMGSAWIESESDSHLVLGTFRGNLAIAALSAGSESRSRVRVSTLREEGIVPRLLTHLELAALQQT